MDKQQNIYVKALSNGQWFGGWAPVQAKLEWLHPSGEIALFILLEEDLAEEDEYAFWQYGSIVLAALEGGAWQVQVGMEEKLVKSELPNSLNNNPTISARPPDSEI
ncbi:MAG: hypothetical protein AAF798_16495 [Bacteroidota bacterium]